MAPPTSFLALSGEIRNQIYEYIFEDISTTPAPDYTLRHLPRSRSTKFSVERQRSRPYLGFTQVCHLLRLEFKPLYNWHKPTVPFLDAPAYLEQYPLPDAEKSQQIAKILQDLGKPVKMDDLTLIDILPLLRYGIKNLPFLLSYHSDIAWSRSHNRTPIVNFALRWANYAGRRCQDCDCTDKVIQISMRQSKVQKRQMKVCVDIVIVLDEASMEGLDGDEMWAVMQKVENHCPTDRNEYTQYRMGLMMFDRRGKKWEVLKGEGHFGY